MLKANVNQEKSPENSAKEETDAVQDDINQTSAEYHNQKDAEENSVKKLEGTKDPNDGLVPEDNCHGITGNQPDEEKSTLSESTLSQNITRNNTCEDGSVDRSDRPVTADNDNSTNGENKNTDQSSTLVESESTQATSPQVTTALSGSNDEGGAKSSSFEELTAAASSAVLDTCENKGSSPTVDEKTEYLASPNEPKLPTNQVNETNSEITNETTNPLTVSGVSKLAEVPEIPCEQSEGDRVSSYQNNVENVTDPIDNISSGISEAESRINESTVAGKIESSLDNPVSDSQPNGSEMTVPSDDLKRGVDCQPDENLPHSYGYSATEDYEMLPDNSTGQLNLSEQPNSDQISAISESQPVEATSLNVASMGMMGEASEPALAAANIKEGAPEATLDSLNDLDTQGVTLSIPEDPNTTLANDTTLLAPDLETEGNPGTRVLLLQRQTDDGSLIQEYVEVPNVTDGDGNLIVYDEMGNQYIIPPSQADAEPPLTEEVVTNETEVVTTGEDPLMRDQAEGLVLEDVELPVVQESPEDSSDHVVVERLQYQDVSFMPTHTRNDVQMSVEVGDEEEESDGEMGQDHLSHDVNHVVVHHNEILDGLAHDALTTDGPFGSHSLADLHTIPGGSVNVKKRKRHVDRGSMEGKPAAPRKRKKKPKVEEERDVSGAALRMPNKFMEPLATSTGTHSFPHHHTHHTGGSGFRSSVMPVSPIRIPVPEMSEDGKDSAQHRARSTSGSNLLSSPTVQPTETPTSQKSHSPIQNKHPTIASLLFKGSSSVSPAVSPRSSSSSPFSSSMMSPNLPKSVSVFQESAPPLPSVSNENSAKKSGVVEQVCKMLPVRPPGWQPQYTTAHQGSSFVKTVTSAITNAQGSSHNEGIENSQYASAIQGSSMMPSPSVRSPAVTSAAPILKIPVPELRAQVPVPPPTMTAPRPLQKPEHSISQANVAEIHRPVPSTHARHASDSISHGLPHLKSSPHIPPSNSEVPMHQETLNRGEKPIVIKPLEERLPPPYPGYNQASTQSGLLQEVVPHPQSAASVAVSQPQGPPPTLQLNQIPAHVHSTVPTPSSAPPSSGVQLTNHASSVIADSLAQVTNTSGAPLPVGPRMRTVSDVMPVRLPVQAVLPHGQVPPLMLPPGVIPPPHLMRGLPPGHAVPIELVRGQRPAFISPTGHILIPTDQLHLLQQGRLLPRNLMPGPPPLVRPQPPMTSVQSVVAPPVMTPAPVSKPAEPIGMVPAPVTPTLPSPRTPELAEDPQSMEDELVKAAHMAEVGQSAAGQMHQVESRIHHETNLPNLPALSASIKQPPQVATKQRPPRQPKHQAEPLHLNEKPPGLSQKPQEGGTTLADKYMKDWQPTGRYKCKFCHYSSVTQNFLFRHWVMSHSGVKPYLCAFCNLKSPTKDGITRHQTAKHKEYPRQVLIDAEQEKLLVRKFRKVFTSLVPYRYHDYGGEEDGSNDTEMSGVDDHQSHMESPDDTREVFTLNSFGKSHENSKGITETYIYSNRKLSEDDTPPAEMRSPGILRVPQSVDMNQLHRDPGHDGQRSNDTRAYPVLKNKIRESFEGERDSPEDMRIKPGQSEFMWPNEEPTSRLSELAGIALSSQAPPPHTIENTDAKMSMTYSYDRKDANVPVNTSTSVRPPVAIHPALQRPPMMLPPLDTLMRPQMMPHMPGMVRTTRPFMPQDVAMSLPSQLLPMDNQAVNMYDKDMLESAMAKHKDAQTIVQLLVSQKRDLPPELQLPGSRSVQSSVPNLVMPQPPPAHQSAVRSMSQSTGAPMVSLSSSVHSSVYSSVHPDYVNSAVGLPTMAGMLKSPVITAAHNRIPETVPYRDIPQLVSQNRPASTGSLPPINELRSPPRGRIEDRQSVASSSMPHVSSVSSTSATAVLLAAAAAAKVDSGAPEQVQTVETSSEALSSSPHVTSTSEDSVDGNANRTFSEDLQLKATPMTLKTLNMAHSSPSPDQSQDAIRTTSNINSTFPEVSSS